MSYAIIRNANYKKENLAGLYKHNERKNTNYSNKDIDKSRSINNYSIKCCPTTYTKRLQQLVSEDDLKGRIIKTTNVMCEFIITSDKEFFDNLSEEEIKLFFEKSYEFVANYNNLGEKYIISAKIHMDESTPHMHIVFVPVVHKKDRKSGKQIEKIACSEYWKGKDSYRRLQDSYYEWITSIGFDLKRGKTSDIEHMSTEKLKQITEYHEQREEIKETLERENQRLKSENKSLKEYIDTTFQVIREVIGFPVNVLRSLIEEHINLKKHPKKKKSIEVFEEELEETECENENPKEYDEK